jgi:hypothetical protein
MSKKPYEPLTSYSELKRVEDRINRAQTIDDIRKIVVEDGPKVGYKAFCYMLGGRMTPEGMKADEACTEAARLEQQGKTDEALAIYKKVIDVYPDHPLARSKLG